jgi:outer membrane protein TolC
MNRTNWWPVRICVCLCLHIAVLGLASGRGAPGYAQVAAEEPLPALHREERVLSVRPAPFLPPVGLPPIPPPQTVAPVPPGAPPPVERKAVALSLDQAIRVALDNSEIVRVMAAGQVVSTGQSVYDPGIAATNVDRARARFDPRYNVSNTFNQIQSPQAFFDLSTPALASISAFDVQDYALRAGVTQTNRAGGTAGLQVAHNDDRFGGFQTLNPSDPFTLNPLDPRRQTAVEFSYVQPLLQGASVRANVAPVVIAQLGTERSFYQLKDSVQSMVKSVIEAYWGVVFARVDLWVARQQVDESRFAFERAKARRARDLADAAEVAQTGAAYSNFRATQITAEGVVLEREAVLRNLLGLLPADGLELVPVTPLLNQLAPLSWDAIATTAEAQRPDIANQKLAVQAAEQALILARNTAWPRVDFVSMYRINGLSGTTPAGASISTAGRDFHDWTLGVNVSAPLGTREARADLRRQELALAREKANLQQSVHAALHQVAASYRNCALNFEQYQAYKETREAAKVNLDQQLAEYQRGRAIYLNVLQAITQWGDAVKAEAQALALYNSELANLERQTGTILEQHGIELLGDNYHSRAPMAPLHDGRSYPQSARPYPGPGRYPEEEQPAETPFQLPENAPRRRREPATPANPAPAGGQHAPAAPGGVAPASYETDEVPQRLPPIESEYAVPPVLERLPPVD